MELTVCEQIAKVQRDKKITNSVVAGWIGISSVNYSRKKNNNLLSVREAEIICKNLGCELSVIIKSDNV